MSQESPAERSDVRRLLRSLPVFAFGLPEFRPETAPDDPVSLFVEWLTSAIEGGVPEPHAMTLSTADADGRPSARVLICKDVDGSGTWYFASSASSRKGHELEANPHAALTFYWPQHGRQIRVRGAVTPTGAERSAADFLARSPGARAEALSSRQSQVLDDPAEAETALRAASDRLAAEPDLVAADWTLYALAAAEVEFWQADERRRHTRLRYERTGGGWVRHRLWP
ncbi:pyridoxal 5'-phosphate synthase [Planotetraspora phitsanulokensis]|uniref:Pyridoxamine 5'-phosphate oxidase n=1 Tax=Planotetraspora phitsanulokensis TaxID=575192 RepID=A0A8J3U9M1_9ACTN|nr:pyridoxal 5'-phosphate synthase [Planotetraspora phitsanulokensis]GII41304.1 pyridoxamine 5'-phosphate oxidase [Planotetraspora phitsanulokensis]